MRRLSRYFPIGLFVLAATAQACGNPTVDDQRLDRRLFQPAGIIRGTVTYQGPRPCSQNGHIIGGALVLIFGANNPPPPKGLATTALNFGVVAGDILFADEPRWPGPEVYCPKDHGITDTILASASFTISPMNAGTYIAQSFYDYTGDFFPLLKIKQLPEFGDIGGGYVDTSDAAKHFGDANYIPTFLPISIGVPDDKGVLQIPYNGYVADNVAVTIASPFPFPRPYFYPSNAEKPDNKDGTDAEGNSTVYLGGSELENLPTGPRADYADFADSADKPGEAKTPHTGSLETDPFYMPIITMTQDHKVYAQPRQRNPQTVGLFQASFKQVRLNWGVAPSELQEATLVDPQHPFFHFQIAPPPSGGFSLWGNYDPNTGKIITIPEGTVPQIWPLVVFAKLQDDAPGAAPHSGNPGGLVPQGDKDHPAIIIQGITLNGDSLFDTAFNPAPRQPVANGGVDHFSVLIRPSAICFNASNPASLGNGTLVSPFASSVSSDPKEQGEKPLLPPDLLNQPGIKGLVSKILPACLPKGRYGINVVYPDGQAWTVPNEAGSCGGAEGLNVFARPSNNPNDPSPTDPTKNTCSLKPRPLLLSQSTRAVLEIVDAQDPRNCQGAHALPPECCPVGWTVNNGDCVPPQ